MYKHYIGRPRMEEPTHMMVDLPAVSSSDGDFAMGEVVHSLQYYSPLLIVFGVVGNTLSALVFRTSRLWGLSTSRYLTALALADLCFLAQLSVTWLDTVGWSDMFNWNGLCQVSVYASYVCCNLSAWLVVAFTLERLVAVKYPLRRNIVCTVSRATTAIWVLTALALAVNLPVLRFAKPTPHCNLDARYLRLADAFNLVDTLISFTIPFVAIVAMNAAICCELCRVRRTRWQLAPTTPAAERARDFDRHKVNGMLLTVSTVFVLFNLPAYSIRVLAYRGDLKVGADHALRLAAFYRVGVVADVSERWITLQHVSLSMFNTNFGINFLLYCMSGENFRKALRNMLGCEPKTTPSGRRSLQTSSLTTVATDRHYETLPNTPPCAPTLGHHSPISAISTLPGTQSWGHQSPTSPMSPLPGTPSLRQRSSTSTISSLSGTPWQWHGFSLTPITSPALGMCSQKRLMNPLSGHRYRATAMSSGTPSLGKISPTLLLGCHSPTSPTDPLPGSPFFGHSSTTPSTLHHFHTPSTNISLNTVPSARWSTTMSTSTLSQSQPSCCYSSMKLADQPRRAAGSYYEYRRNMPPSRTPIRLPRREPPPPPPAMQQGRAAAPGVLEAFRAFISAICGCLNRPREELPVDVIYENREGRMAARYANYQQDSPPGCSAAAGPSVRVITRAQVQQEPDSPPCCCN